jgi:DNA (cytosine-5)-methyltransferase 1
MQSEDASQTELIVEADVGSETFVREAEKIFHKLDIGSLRLDASIPATEMSAPDVKGAWWLAYLLGVVPAPVERSGATLRYVDLFSGSGGLARGVRQLAIELGVDLVPELVVDLDEEATKVHAANHGTRRRSTESVTSLLDFNVRARSDESEFVYPPELIDSSLAEGLAGVDLVLAGPPCQGHSNLNNHTRRDDPRNRLYLTVPAFAVALGAPLCIIENVPAILNDADDIVAIATALFESSGYRVTSGVLSASAMGWPQTRKRHFLVARSDAAPVTLERVAEVLAEDQPRSMWWAVEDLEHLDTQLVIDQPSELSAENMARVDWLFDNDAYDLALSERPQSHRNGTSYQAVYGRMHKDRPAQTITTGFMTPGRGRYVHPTRRRGLTPHEAARLQGFPDTYRFVVDPDQPPTRAKLAKWIGDAVPMPLGYAAGLSALGYGLPGADRLD